MTTNQKWILGIAIAVILIIIFRKQIGSLWNGMSSRTIDTSNAPAQQTTIVQPVIVPVEPIHPPHPAPPPQWTCEQLNLEIKGIKAKIAVTMNPQLKAQLQQYLAGLENQYAKMGCVGPPPPPSQQV